MNKLQKQNLLNDALRLSNYTDQIVYCVIKEGGSVIKDGGYVTTIFDVVKYLVKYENFKVYAKCQFGKVISL